MQGYLISAAKPAEAILELLCHSIKDCAVVA
jgi:hypothetical protein